jgi:alkanesulfonate monooxygenase SsuD/methylene tetrahydromethanopterin reductase-like flavin-dependent oxidoreductase (luciferase family)
LLLRLNEKERVTWNGKFRSALNGASIAPRPFQKSLPIWVGVGGTPESVARAGRLGLNMALGILGGDPLRVSVTGHSYISKSSKQALDEFHPHYVNYFSYFMKERGQRFWVSRSDLDEFRRDFDQSSRIR